MTSSPYPLIVSVVPAAGMSRRMGRSKAALAFRGGTMVGTVVRSLLEAGSDKVLVVTRSELVPQLDLPMDGRVTVLHNNDPKSEMIDSIWLGLGVIATPRSLAPAESASQASRDLQVARSPRRPRSVARTSVTATAIRHGVPSVDRSRMETGRRTRRKEVDATRCGLLVVPADMPAITVETFRMCMDAFRVDPSRIIIAACHGRRGHPVVFPLTLLWETDRPAGGLRELVAGNRDRVSLVETTDPGVLCDVDTPADYGRLISNGDGPAT